jgi:hypothetical protein
MVLPSRQLILTLKLILNHNIKINRKKAKMEKKNYFAPEVKFHQLKARTAMLQSTTDLPIDDGDGDAAAKSGMLFFDEDED